ncbi:MAG TPA: CaiB/BaiF CoA-transferase family protein [Candidatus Eisenbacteria bacterium]|nr:CaiB/BaiF CoA-transferase family protein [Candidatus Eisenbacteria bacterium]
MTASSSRRGALSGVRVLDFSHQAAGPWATSLLGDMGADVIKIEKPGRGDSIRYADRSGRLPPEIGGLNFQGLNRNKRGITIDIGTPQGVALVQRLAKDADVVVENFRPGVMDRHEIGYQHLRKINPRIIYCSITAFGPRGPLAQKPGMDLIIQATGALMGHTGEEGGPPIKSAPPVADINTGIYAAYGICGALFERERSGEGQHVEVAMLDAVLSLFADNAANVLTEGVKFGKFGSGHPDLVPYQAFPASDGYFIVACLTNAFYKRLAAALGRDDLLNDPRFATNPSRVKHRDYVVGVLSEIFEQNTCDHWIRLLEKNDIPTCRVNRLEDVLHSEQIKENGLVVERQDEKRGRISILGPPVHLSRTQTTFERLAPAIGEHTDEVLREFGLSAAEIADLHAAKVV